MAAFSSDRSFSDGRLIYDLEDIYKVDLTGAHVVVIYLLPAQIERLIPQFQQMPAGAQVVFHYIRVD